MSPTQKFLLPITSVLLVGLVLMVFLSYKSTSSQKQTSQSETIRDSETLKQRIPKEAIRKLFPDSYVENFEDVHYDPESKRVVFRSAEAIKNIYNIEWSMTTIGSDLHLIKVHPLNTFNLDSERDGIRETEMLFNDLYGNFNSDFNCQNFSHSYDCFDALKKWNDGTYVISNSLAETDVLLIDFLKGNLFPSTESYQTIYRGKFDIERKESEMIVLLAKGKRLDGENYILFFYKQDDGVWLGRIKKAPNQSKNFPVSLLPANQGLPALLKFYQGGFNMYGGESQEIFLYIKNGDIHEAFSGPYQFEDGFKPTPKHIPEPYYSYLYSTSFTDTDNDGVAEMIRKKESQVICEDGKGAVVCPSSVIPEKFTEEIYKWTDSEFRRKEDVVGL